MPFRIASYPSNDIFFISFYLHLHTFFTKTGPLDAPRVDARGRRIVRTPLCTPLILDVNTDSSAPGKPHAACSQKVEDGCLRIRGGTLDVQSLLTTTYHHPTMNAFLRGLLPVLRRSIVRVSSSTVRDSCSSAASPVCDPCRQ